MSSSKQSELSVVVSWVRWWLFRYLHGTQGYGWSCDAWPSRGGKSSWLLIIRDALRQLADRCDKFHFMNLKCGCWRFDAAIKEGQLPTRGQTCFASPKIGFFEKDFLFQQGTSHCGSKVVTSSKDLSDIDLSKNYVLKTATGVTMAMVRRLHLVQKKIWKKLLCASWLGRLCLEEFVNLDLEISVIVSGNGKDVWRFSSFRKYPPQQHPFKTIVPARISESLADKAKAMAVRIAEQLNSLWTL